MHGFVFGEMLGFEFDDLGDVAGVGGCHGYSLWIRLGRMVLYILRSEECIAKDGTQELDSLLIRDDCDGSGY